MMTMTTTMMMRKMSIRRKAVLMMMRMTMTMPMIESIFEDSDGKNEDVDTDDPKSQCGANVAQI